MVDAYKMKAEMQDVLKKNILHFWMTQMVDEEHGGFYGRMDHSGTLHPDAEKGAILNARILWSFSAAYRVLGNPEYLAMATRAKDYIIDHFIDPEYGGIYWSVDYKGQPLDTVLDTVERELFEHAAVERTAGGQVFCFIDRRYGKKGIFHKRYSD